MEITDGDHYYLHYLLCRRDDGTYEIWEQRCEWIGDAWCGVDDCGAYFFKSLTKSELIDPESDDSWNTWDTEVDPELGDYIIAWKLYLPVEGEQVCPGCGSKQFGNDGQYEDDWRCDSCVTRSG